MLGPGTKPLYLPTLPYPTPPMTVHCTTAHCTKLRHSTHPHTCAHWLTGCFCFPPLVRAQRVRGRQRMYVISLGFGHARVRACMPCDVKNLASHRQSRLWAPTIRLRRSNKASLSFIFLSYRAATPLERVFWKRSMEEG